MLEISGQELTVSLELLPVKTWQIKKIKKIQAFWEDVMKNTF